MKNVLVSIPLSVMQLANYQIDIPEDVLGEELIFSKYRNSKINDPKVSFSNTSVNLGKKKRRKKKK